MIWRRQKTELSIGKFPYSLESKLRRPVSKQIPDSADNLSEDKKLREF